MRRLSAAGMAALALLACGGQTPRASAAPARYQALDPEARRPEGYSQVQLTPDSWQVTYLGNNRISHQTVERDLLYRAAQLTMEQGYDWFETANREGARTVSPVEGGETGWRPGWRYFGTGFGWRDWDPERQDPLWRQHETAGMILNYEATEEIRLHTGTPPPGRTDVFDARVVANRLADKVGQAK